MSSRAAPSSKRPRTGSGDETATDTSSNTISAGDMAHNYQMLHQKMSECFDYILPAETERQGYNSPDAEETPTGRQGRNLTCHLCGTHSEKKKSVGFYQCKNGNCQRTRGGGDDGTTVCGSDRCLDFMHQFFNFQCPKCSGKCCCVKQGKDWRHRHDSTVSCPCKNKRNTKDKFGVSSVTCQDTGGGAAGSVISSASTHNPENGQLSQRVNEVEVRQHNIEEDVKHLSEDVRSLSMNEAKLIAGKLLDRCRKLQNLESGGFNDGDVRRRAFHYLDHIDEETYSYVEMLRQCKTRLEMKHGSNLSEEEIRMKCWHEATLFGNTPSGLLQFSQCKRQQVQEAAAAAACQSSVALVDDAPSTENSLYPQTSTTSDDYSRGYFFREGSGRSLGSMD